jgi:hypothetical protein
MVRLTTLLFLSAVLTSAALANATGACTPATEVLPPATARCKCKESVDVLLKFIEAVVLLAFVALLSLFQDRVVVPVWKHMTARKERQRE